MFHTQASIEAGGGGLAVVLRDAGGLPLRQLAALFGETSLRGDTTRLFHLIGEWF